MDVQKRKMKLEEILTELVPMDSWAPDFNHEELYRQLEQLFQPTTVKRRIRLKLDYNLMTDQVSKSMDCAKGRDYTAFVNKRRTLVHVMLHDHPSVLIRLPGLKMKDWSRKAMRELIEKLLYEFF